MKKIFKILLSIIAVIYIGINLTQALSVADFSPAIDKKVAKMKTTEEKVKFLQTFSDLLTDPVFTKDKNAKLFLDVREYTLNMLNVFQAQLAQEQPKNTSTTKTTNSTNTKFQTSSSNTTAFPHLSDNFSNIDIEKVRQTILSRHNDERSSLGINSYAYNIDLEGSATYRANKLADSGKTSGLHVRNSGDGYYNYNSMLNRFSGLGINFPSSINGAASFSESIGWNTYKCSKSDCTDELINAIKKTRTGIIMKEKSSNGSHYRAATMKHFTQMGAGIAVSNNRYYLVLHYGVDF